MHSTSEEDDCAEKQPRTNSWENIPEDLQKVLEILYKVKERPPQGIINSGKVLIEITEIESCIDLIEGYVRDVNSLTLTMNEMSDLRKASDQFGMQPEVLLSANLFGIDLIPQMKSDHNH